jgi:hypothetical protein
VAKDKTNNHDAGASDALQTARELVMLTPHNSQQPNKITAKGTTRETGLTGLDRGKN